VTPVYNRSYEFNVILSILIAWERQLNDRYVWLCNSSVGYNTINSWLIVVDKDPAVDKTQSNIQRQNHQKSLINCIILFKYFSSIYVRASVVANERSLLLYIAWKIVIKVSIRNRKAIFGLRGRAFLVGCCHVFVRRLRLFCYPNRKPAVAFFFEMSITIQNCTVLKASNQHTEPL
jgi:hypothetical protein